MKRACTQGFLTQRRKDAKRNAEWLCHQEVQNLVIQEGEEILIPRAIKQIDGNSHFRICHYEMAMVLYNGMKDTLVPIDGAGRIVLPKSVREDLAIKPGDVFKVSVSGATVTLTPGNATAGFVRSGKALVFSAGGAGSLSQETIQEALEAGREERHVRVASGLPARKRTR
jgi:AbrB family looped-hinge helix DNA binding protein